MKNYFYITPKDYEAANKIGLSKKDVYRRVYEENWSIERAISTPKMKMKPMTKYTEEEKETIKKNGLTTRIVSQRVCRGWSIEKAINTPPIQPQQKAHGRGRYKYNDEIILNLHGHTHPSPGIIKISNTYVFNPGSLRKGSFGEINIQKKEGKWIINEIKHLNIGKN